MKVFTTNNISLYKVKKYLKAITELVPVFYDMCENSCICYTGEYESYQKILEEKQKSYAISLNKG